MFIGQYTADLSEQFSSTDLVVDKSLFKARGPVWHQADRKASKVPNHLRNLDTDATWSKSSYHGWVYGYGLHIICTQDAFPALLTVQSASVSESWVIDKKASEILTHLSPKTLTANDAYTQASRIRRWAKSQVALITPALRWTKDRLAEAYHRFIDQSEQRFCLSKRRSSVKLLFDLIAKMIATTPQQKRRSGDFSMSGRVWLSGCYRCKSLRLLMQYGTYQLVMSLIWRLRSNEIPCTPLVTN